MSLLNLPEGIHDEIFLKLPAKSILVSRCVCKLFYNLLSIPNFIKNHVNRTNQSKKNPKLLFGSYKNPGIYSIPIDYASISSAPPPSSSSLYKCDGAVPLNYPFKSEDLYKYSFNFLGSCNGLICFKITTSDRAVHRRGGYKKVADYFSILNPLTREFKEFTKPPGYDPENAVYGFGYDSKIDDYKLVIISRCLKNCGSRIDVYTMRSDSWNSVQHTVKYSITSRLRSNGVFFNGALHWLGGIAAQQTSSEVIVSFDLSNELMIDMPLPEYSIGRPSGFQWDIYLGVWGNCVCIAIGWQLVKIDVWVMQEYGVKESWIKKFTTTRAMLPQEWDLITDWHPLWSFDNGEVLVYYCPAHLLLCDQSNERVRSVLAGKTGSNIESYVESIVSLDSGTYVEKGITDGIAKNLK